VDGEVSADGHEWSDRAFAGDYNEKTRPQIYPNRRKWDLTSGEDLANPPDAYRGGPAQRKGLWVVHFGEMTRADGEASTPPRRALARAVRTRGRRAGRPRPRRRPPLRAARRVPLRPQRGGGQYALYDQLGAPLDRADPRPGAAQPVRRRCHAVVERVRETFRLDAVH